MNELATAQQVADRLNISRKVLRSISGVGSGRLPYIQITRRQRRYRWNVVERWLREREPKMVL